MKDLKYIDAKKELPFPDFLDETCNGKYLVVTEYGLQLCMFCQNELDELDWYTNYSSKLITPVIGWYKKVDSLEISIKSNLEVIKKVSSKFEIDPFGVFFIQANSGFNPNDPKEDFQLNRSIAVWYSLDEENWIKGNKPD